MQKNDLIRVNSSIYRVIAIKDNKVLVIDTLSLTMPKWVDISMCDRYESIENSALVEITKVSIPDIESLSQEQMKIMHNRFTLIAPILSCIEDDAMRSLLINETASKHNVTKQTVRKYLCLYLVYQNITVLSPTKKEPSTALTTDEKNFRYALNKYFYTRYKHTLTTTYLYLLRDKYTDEKGELLQGYPSFRKFQYFYQKNKNQQTYYISRDGLTNYQRNHRPLLGNSVRDFAPNVGVGMLDSTICDIYLVNESKEVVGRPIFTACIDGYSGMCLGYYLGWEGGVYSIKELLLNVVTDKAEHCKKKGIAIDKGAWDCSELPATLVTDMGSEYKSESVEHLTELGVSVVNLNPYRPDLKSSVEKFFDIVQNFYKPHLKGKGVIESDFQERGGRDYRLDACLTLREFEQILIRCILHYNNHRVIDFPFTKEMMDNGVKPYSSSLWSWGRRSIASNLIPIDKQTLSLCLLPRTKGIFTRRGLMVNKLRYKAKGFTNDFLKGGDCLVAYNPDNVGVVWLVRNGEYIAFTLISSTYKEMTIDEVDLLENQYKEILGNARTDSMQARLDLMESIEVIAKPSSTMATKTVKNIRETRAKETKKTHKENMVGNTI